MRLNIGDYVIPVNANPTERIGIIENIECTDWVPQPSNKPCRYCVAKVRWHGNKIDSFVSYSYLSFLTNPSPLFALSQVDLYGTRH